MGTQATSKSGRDQASDGGDGRPGEGSDALFSDRPSKQDGGGGGGVVGPMQTIC